MNELNVIDPHMFADVDVSIQSGLHNHLLSEMCEPSDINAANRHLFSNTLDDLAITNQKRSGRCWIFAGLNMLRPPLVKKLNLDPKVELSQSYLYFYHLLEQCNYFVSKVEDTKHLATGERVVDYILATPFEDGGQWHMFVSLVNKYGVVPQSVFPETLHSSNTAGLKHVLNAYLRRSATLIKSDREFDRAKFLRDIYATLVKFLGSPPVDEFTWEYMDKDKKFARVTSTPLEFYNTYISPEVNVSNYVSLVNDPRNEYGTIYTTEYLGNVVGGEPIRHLNLPMERLLDLTRQQIERGERVWYGSDVGKSYNGKHNIGDSQYFDCEKLLGLQLEMSKADVLRYSHGLITHAMNFVGFHTDKDDKVVRWKVENSWGSDNFGKGYLSQEDSWVLKNVYQVIIRKDLVTDEELREYDGGDVIVLPPWDPMGSLA
jgi:bleomycin hydrolase